MTNNKNEENIFEIMDKVIEEMNNIKYFSNFHAELKYIDEIEDITCITISKIKNIKIHIKHQQILEGFVKGYLQTHRLLENIYYGGLVFEYNNMNAQNYNIDHLNNEEFKEEMYSIFPEFPYDQI